jgi:hypothetical protein
MHTGFGLCPLGVKIKEKEKEKNVLIENLGSVR